MTNVAWFDGGGGLCAQVTVALVAVHGALDDEGGGHGIAAQAGHGGLGVSPAEGSLGVKVLAPSCSCTQWGHVGFDRRVRGLP
jgi:hypothetical protein